MAAAEDKLTYDDIKRAIAETKKMPSGPYYLFVSPTNYKLFEEMGFDMRHIMTYEEIADNLNEAEDA